MSKTRLKSIVGSLLVILALAGPPISNAARPAIRESGGHATSPAIQVLEQETVSQFPESLTFRLQARSRQGDIVSASSQPSR